MSGCPPAKKKQLMAKFRQYDADSNGYLDLDELTTLLKAGNPNLPDTEIEKLYYECDASGDGKIQVEEFIDFIYGREVSAHAAGRTTAGRHARQQAAAACGDDGTEDQGSWGAVEAAFTDYCASNHGAKDLDNNHFQKYIRDSKIKLKGPDIDLVFSKVVPKGKRRMDFHMFQAAIREIAKRAKVSNVEIMNKFADCHGQDIAANSTKTEYSKFYDDKSTFTGAACYNDNLGAKDAADSALGRRERTVGALKKTHEVGDDEDEALWAEVERVFYLFADEEGKGNKKLEGKEFLKMCEDIGLIKPPSFRREDVDITFTTAARKEKGLTMDASDPASPFKIAVRVMAQKRDEAIYITQGKIANSTGPKKHGTTKLEAVRFHDDKSTYTGAHVARFGEGREGHGDDRHDRLKAEHDAAMNDDENEHPWDEVQKTFQAYGGDNGVDGKELQKLCEDCGIFTSKFTSNNMDVVFAGAVEKGKRKLDWPHFQKAVRGIAKSKGCPTAEVQAKIAGGSSGPQLHGTEAEYVAFHDDKSLYTGAHVGK